MVFNIDSAQLTTQITRVDKTKYFPVEIACANMKPNVTYHAYYDGILVDAFCKSYGKNLGDPLTSDANGKLMIQFHLAVQYKQQYLAVQSPDNNNIQIAKAFELRTADNAVSSITYLQMFLKAG